MYMARYEDSFSALPAGTVHAGVHKAALSANKNKERTVSVNKVWQMIHILSGTQGLKCCSSI